jgi:U3 small nucleolar RNA-associated protein 23
MKDHEKATNGKSRGRPGFLPPPMELPLRYCKHKNDEGEELGVIEEARCLLDLLAGQPKGNEVPKNKQHYILATADAPEQEQKMRGYIDIREKARYIPGVPVIYVKRSVMILEDLSASSERAKRGAENDKFREGLIGNRKRKRAEEDEGDEVLNEVTQGEDHDFATKRRPHKARGPNPLSVQKKKVKITTGDHTKPIEVDDSRNPTTSRRGKRGKKKLSHMLVENASEMVGGAVGMDD